MRRRMIVILHSQHHCNLFENSRSVELDSCLGHTDGRTDRP